jgi:hypothetical protein
MIDFGIARSVDASVATDNVRVRREFVISGGAVGTEAVRSKLFGPNARDLVFILGDDEYSSRVHLKRG